MPSPDTTADALAAQPATSPPSPGREWRRTASAWLGALVLYWLTLFIGTHTPVERIGEGVLSYDKLLHGGAYFVLATIALIAWRRTGARFGLGGRAAVALLVLGYGAFDELTQPYVGRSCDLHDWVADAAGVLLAVIVDQWRHRNRR